MTDLTNAPKKIRLESRSFFEIMSMVRQCQYYGYQVTDWDKRYGTFFGFITHIDYYVFMERVKEDDCPLQEALDRYDASLQRLQKAIESENYEEAARLRDLMNKPR